MSDPNGDDTFLYELEVEVRAELIVAEGGGSAEEAVAPIEQPIEQWLVDPLDAEREAIMLRSMLGAVEALERDRDRPAGPEC